MAELHYYAQRKSINGEGVPQTPSNFYGTRRAMERQYHLFCANTLAGDDFVNQIDTIEWGTLETGSVERIVYVKEQTQPTPEPEPEPEENPEEPTEPEGT